MFSRPFWAVKSLLAKCGQWSKVLSASIAAVGELPAGGNPCILLSVSDGRAHGSRAPAPYTCQHVYKGQGVTWPSLLGSKTQCAH